MSKRYNQLLKNQPQIKVVAQAHNSQKDARLWLLALGAAAASVMYLFGFFFSFTGGRVPAGD